MRIYITLLLTIYIPLQILAKEYTIHIKEGWQLLGLPVGVESLEEFDNRNVRLIWSYDSEKKEWLGYSPERSVTDKLLDADIRLFSSLKRWQGFWVYSYNSWDLTVSDSSYDSSQKDELPLSRGWNLLSMPIDTVLSHRFFKYNRIWKYSDSEWKTNGSFDFVDYSPIEAVDSGNGFWLYSDSETVVDLRVETSKISGFSNYSEAIQEIENSSIFGENIETNLSVAIGNESDSIKRGRLLQSTGENIFFVDESGSSVQIDTLDEVLQGVSGGRSVQFTPSRGSVDIREIYVEGNNLIVISELSDPQTEPSFEDRCRSKRVQVSMIELELSSNSVDMKSKRDIQIDGEVLSTRSVDGNLYLITNFQPCVEISYQRDYLDSEDICFFTFEENFMHKNQCSDVYLDESSNRPYREHIDKPYVSNSYPLPKLWNGVEDKLFINTTELLGSSKLNQSNSITTVSRVDTLNGIVESTVSYLGSISSLYTSDNSIYLFSEQFGEYSSFVDYEKYQTLYKFSYYPAIRYKGQGSFRGELLNRDSLIEFDMTLSIGAKDRLINFQDRDGEMVEVAELNLGSMLQNLLFFGERAIMVTDKNQLHTLNIEDPLNPIRVGSTILSVDAKFLQLLEDDQLLIVGREVIGDTTEGIQMDLYNISTFEKPTIEDSYTFGDYFNFTPIKYNRDSFTYNSSEKAFSLPIGGYGTSKSVKSGLYNYRIYDRDSGVAITPENSMSISQIDEVSDDLQTSIFKKDGITYSLFYQNGKIYINQIDKIVD